MLLEREETTTGQAGVMNGRRVSGEKTLDLYRDFTSGPNLLEDWLKDWGAWREREMRILTHARARQLGKTMCLSGATYWLDGGCIM